MRYITHPRRLLLALTLVMIGLLASACGGSSTKASGQIHVLTWHGIVNPVMERYIDRGIDTAERSDALAVVIKLDTPGGLDSAMREIIQRMEASTVPVIVYVSPSGGRAASAGTFITMAAQVAAMAPNTTIGAASAINSDGSDIGGTLGKKVENDAVAYIRGIAELRGRNPDWAEQAVRDAVAVNQNDAVDLNVVDFVADNLNSVLAQSDGRTVQVPDAAGELQDVTLSLSGAPIYTNNTNFFEELLYVIADPNIAFLLISLGGLALVFEVIHPSGLTGIFGAIALVLAFFALGSLPTNWAGVALIVFGFVLIGVEIIVPGFGAFGIGGIIALLLGGLILTGSSETGFQVSRWLVVVMAAIIGVLTLGFLTILVKARRMPSQTTGRESLIGSKGTTKGDLKPSGPVMVRGERWDAVAEDPPLPEGTPIIVTTSEGFVLRVKRDPASILLLPEASKPEPEEAATPTTQA
jgi:membrane-bound serine protease (ClpP class)